MVVLSASVNGRERWCAAAGRRRTTVRAVVQLALHTQPEVGIVAIVVIVGEQPRPDAERRGRRHGGTRNPERLFHGRCSPLRTARSTADGPRHGAL
jgi:hypothetical protein